MKGLRYRPTQPNVFRVTQPESTSNVEASFGALVRERRNLLSLTQEDLRRRLLDGYGIDLSKTAMSRLEQGERPIRLNEVFALARILGIDLSTYGRKDPVGPQFQELSAELEEATMRLDAIEREISIASMQVAQHQAALDESRAKLASLQEKHNSFRHQRDQLEISVRKAMLASERLREMGSEHGEH